ncbi:hypothetical protein CAXC1_60010 [Candidatus Xenohaliotis californiensis]|uniref:Cell division protein ZapA n=1 Tax=Candidatus Xenohaliotis californiensis TaxID=84677 RepID=A0ABM9N8Z4_9RICK|nr:hypothetical protein CAXC1_60010 [Candidatus Xenohaliotis californiensis]
MPVIEIKVGEIIHHVTCAEDDLERLRFVSEQLNKRIAQIQSELTDNARSVPSITLVIVAALRLQDELIDLFDEYNFMLKNKKNCIIELKELLSLSKKLLQDRIEVLDFFLK